MVLFSFLSIVDDVKNGPVNSDSVKTIASTYKGND